MIAVSTPTTFGGAILDGINSSLMYFRSKDGGETWDKTDSRLPGIDGTRYNRMSPDAYSITVKDDKVVIGSYGDFYDTEIWTSSDNGDNFTRKTIIDFPLENYVLDALYSEEDIPADPNAPDPLAILSSDGCGLVFIDNNNKTHLIVGNMYYLDNAVDNGSFSYFPYTNGFFHWDENTPDSLFYLDAYPDLNEDGEANLEDIGKYYNSLTSYPTLAQGKDNTLYLAYTVPSELYLNPNNGINNRHVFITFSKDGGATWSKPYDIIADKTLFDDNNFFSETAETAFPYLAQNVDDNLHLIYQLDYTPGMHVQHPDDETIEFEDNEQVYTAIPVNRITNTKNATLEAAAVKLFPNPVSTNLNIKLTLEGQADVRFTLTDITGRVILSKNVKNASELETIDMRNYATGTYFLTTTTAKGIRTDKIIKK